MLALAFRRSIARNNFHHGWQNRDPSPAWEVREGTAVEDKTDRNRATEAREGVTGHTVRHVLIISTCGIVLLFAGLWLYFFG